MKKLYFLKIRAFVFVLVLVGISLFFTIENMSLVNNGGLYLLVMWLGRTPASVAHELAQYTTYVLIILQLLIGYLLYRLIWKSTMVGGSESVTDIYLSREEFKELYEYSPLPYFSISKKGLISRPNRAALRLFKASPEELENKKLVELVSDDNKDRARELIEKYRREIFVDRQELQIKRADGALRWVLISIFSGEKLGTNESGFVAMVDVTEQKEVEKTKTEFVSLASHQLRTPLTSLGWYSEILLDKKTGELNDKQKLYLEKLNKQASIMSDLVDTLLNVSRIEMGKIEITKKDFDVAETIESILEELESRIIEKKLLIQKDYKGPLVLNTDPKLLRIMLQNLISNAVKYTPNEGQVWIKANLVGNNLSVEVRDTGYGIPPEDKSKIFKKLYRASNVRSKDVKGTGLGLYMTKSFTEMLGGKIDFESEVGKGSTFKIILPKN